MSTTDRPTIKTEAAPDETLGQTLGRYKLLEKIGGGGFGVVYVAEQKEPVKRRVALKIIKLGMDTRQVVARFEAERQALATHGPSQHDASKAALEAMRRFLAAHPSPSPFPEISQKGWDQSIEAPAERSMRLTFGDQDSKELLAWTEAEQKQLGQN